MERHIGVTYKEDYVSLKKELDTLKIEKKIADIRIKQLQQYRQLETSVRGAKVILEFADVYHLKGNFQQIRNIALVS